MQNSLNTSEFFFKGGGFFRNGRTRERGGEILEGLFLFENVKSRNISELLFVSVGRRRQIFIHFLSACFSLSVELLVHLQVFHSRIVSLFCRVHTLFQTQVFRDWRLSASGQRRRRNCPGVFAALDDA